MHRCVSHTTAFLLLMTQWQHCQRCVEIGSRRAKWLNSTLTNYCCCAPCCALLWLWLESFAWRLHCCCCCLFHMLTLCLRTMSTHTQNYLYILIYKHTDMQTWIHTYLYTYLRIPTHIYINIYIHVHIHSMYFFLSVFSLHSPFCWVSLSHRSQLLFICCFVCSCLCMCAQIARVFSKIRVCVCVCVCCAFYVVVCAFLLCALWLLRISSINFFSYLRS